MQTCQNDLGFSLYAMSSIYYVVATSDERKEFEIEVSTNWYVVIKY